MCWNSGASAVGWGGLTALYATLLRAGSASAPPAVPARDRLPVPFVTLNRDGQPAEVRRAAGGAAPPVIAETGKEELLVLLGRDDLERCAGSPDRWVDAVEAATAARGLRWQTAMT